MTALLEHTTDPLILENAKLRRQLSKASSKIQYLEQQHSTALAQCANDMQGLRDENDTLKGQIAWFKRQLFGSRSERTVPLANANQLYLEGFEPGLKSADEEKTSDNPGPPPKPRKKRTNTCADTITLPDDIPVEIIYLDIPEEQKVCPNTGTPLVKIGEEVSNKLAHKQASYFIKQYIRPKYAYPKEADQGILTADLPGSLLSRSQADESFLAEICVRKYADHLPLYRQVEILAREGIKISRQQLSQWIMAAAKALRPLYNLMVKMSKAGEILFIDETPVKLLGKSKGKARQAYLWTLVGGCGHGPKYTVFHFKKSREHIHAEELLKGYAGYVHADKYEAYIKLAARVDTLWHLCPCWSHIRRYFFEAETGLEVKEWFLAKIRQLFLLERIAWTRSPEERLKIRREKEVPIIDEMIEEAQKRLESGKDLPKSKIRAALAYFYGLKPYLKNYIKNPYAHLDNNLAERQIRPIAIGRKNWLFVGCEEGGEATAIFCSLIQTCRSMQINPREYLEDVMRKINDYPHSRLSELLPDQWAKQHNGRQENEPGAGVAQRYLTTKSMKKEQSPSINEPEGLPASTPSLDWEAEINLILSVDCGVKPSAIVPKEQRATSPTKSNAEPSVVMPMGQGAKTQRPLRKRGRKAKNSTATPPIEPDAESSIVPLEEQETASSAIPRTGT